jgi:copper chaperone CopZ
MKYSFKALGMMCQGCVNNVKTHLLKVEGVEKVEVDLASKSVTVTTNKEIPEEIFKKTVLKAGYTYSK